MKLIESAEATGELDPVLEEIAEMTERRIRLRNGLVTSMLYPSIVIFVSVAVAVFLVLKVIPKFAEFFLKRNIELPATTKFLVDLSAWIRVHGAVLLLVLGILVLAGCFAAMTRPGRFWLDRNVLRLPVFGGLLTTAAMARLAQTLGTLIRSGVNLLEALRITAQVMGNRAYAARLDETSESILQGENLETGLTGPPIPDLVPQVVGVGRALGYAHQCPGGSREVLRG